MKVHNLSEILCPCFSYFVLTPPCDFCFKIRQTGKKNVGKTFILNLLQENQIIQTSSTLGFKAKNCNDSANSMVQKMTFYDHSGSLPLENFD